ncbi:MAG TPA: phosphoribosylglycinamide formyltransferase [Nitrospina sp.]|jgi:phosphoribosylglycinamide formyltransferase-1|nr:phosphoribosylglycinamide formyltransferase [Nitrospinaceae bacterium]MDP7148487.1 phosphoribosylglycinamide formyltransferase [Nitrospinaceae bacterium]HAX46485.1 phosphoribosylglycinamide formyltransferase [Nitrospina sp.]|tara:strand:- start:1997 stop:2617 length:621 start_codon:yes stop_codon:yes gene_type:complete
MSLNKFKLAVLVSGRGSNLQAIIDSIERNALDVQLSLVLSNVKDALALQRAEKHGIETIFIDPATSPNRKAFDRVMIDKLKEMSVDLICLAGYMRILGKEFIQAFSTRIINIHPSLLPAFPGLDAQKQAIEYGVKLSGCTVHFVDEGIDSGPIILQTAVPVYDHDSEDSLAQRILEQEHILYPKAIKLIAEKKLNLNGRTVIYNKS